MSFEPNNLVNVSTLQSVALAKLENLNCFISTANTKFKDFQDITANLGYTVNMNMPYRFEASQGLVVDTFGATTMRYRSLTCDQSAKVSYAFDNLERLFTIDKQNFMEEIGSGAVTALSSFIEGNVAKNANSSVVSYTSKGVANGVHTESGPYRFFGDGKVAINSYQQLEQAVTNFTDTGAPKNGMKMYVPNVAVPAIVGSGLSQFVMKRNEEIASSWELGKFGNATYYRSNMLPVHTAGLIGNGATDAIQTLTVVSTDDPTGANITEITCTCDASLSGESGVIKAGDLMEFQNDTIAAPTFKTYYGGIPTSQRVQIRAVSDADADTTTVVLSILPSLTITPDSSDKIGISTNIVAGMKIKVLPSHRCGLLVSGNSLMLAMPKLRNEVPFTTVSKYDDATNVSMRMYFGSIFGQNEQGIVFDSVYGTFLDPDYCMRVIFPL